MDYTMDYREIQTKLRNGEFEYFEENHIKYKHNIIDFKLSFIDFKLSYKDIFEKKAREYLAAYRIQQWWYKITLSPEYKVGRKFINRKYDECFE